MATQEQIDLVKINLSGPGEHSIDEDQISKLLDVHQSVPYVSYKLCLMRTSNTDVTLGPISIKGDVDYWKNMAQFYLDEYKQELAEKETRANSGSTILMRRADGT